MKGTITSPRDAFITWMLMLFDSSRYLAVIETTWFEQILTPLLLAFLSKVVQIKLSSGWLLHSSPARQSAFLLPGPSHQPFLKPYHLPVREGGGVTVLKPWGDGEARERA